MIKHEDKVISAFKRFHGLKESDDVTLVYSHDTFDPISIEYRKDGLPCWGSTLEEFALDLVLEKGE